MPHGRVPDGGRCRGEVDSGQNNQPKPGARQPFVGLAVFASLGVCAADLWPQNAATIWTVEGAAALLLLLRWRTGTCWFFTAATFFALHHFHRHWSPARLLSSRLGETGQPVWVQGVVASEPEPTGSGKGSFSILRSRCVVRVEEIHIDQEPLRAALPVLVTWTGHPPRLGDRVCLGGFAENLPPARNPGTFDSARYRQRTGIYSRVQTRFERDCQVLAHGAGNAWVAWGVEARAWAKTQLARGLEEQPQAAHLIDSMVLGVRGESLEELRELFQTTGTLHLFAVSGLNVAMLAALVGFLLKPLGTGPIVRVLLTLPVLGAYALITGGGPSCLRATLMGVLVLGGILLARRTLLPNHLAAAACLILAWDTNQLFLPGFQFSFVLVIALMTGVPWMQTRLEPLGLPDPLLPRTLWNVPQRAWVRVWRPVAASLSVTATAWLASLLLMAGYFHIVAPGALLANLLAVPLAFGILALGLGSVSTGSFAPGLCLLLNETNALLIRVLVGALEMCARIPGSHFYVESPRLRPPCEIQVLDVGPGAAAHVRVAGSDWLVDCGSAALYASVVRPALRSRGVNRLDGLILTHGDTAHVGGAAEAVGDFAPRQIFESGLGDRSRIRRGFHRQLAAAGRGKALCVRGDTLPVAPGVFWEVLYPPAGLARATADDKALVLRLTADGFRVLWTSDSGFGTESWLLENEPDLGAAILIKGQHERDFSGTPEFLARVNPQVIIAAAPGWRQTELDSGSDAPSEQGAVLFRQERSGAVLVQIEGAQWTVAGFLDAQIFRSRAR